MNGRVLQQKRIRRDWRAQRALALGCAMLLLALLAGLVACGDGNPSGQATGDGASASQAEATPEGTDIVIPIADITDKARFYPTTVGGTAVEVLAVKAPDGSIRTAFNTCQVCFDSGRGYYVQEGDVLVCQNCGNRFATDDVEIKTGGCNPVPIFDEDKTVTESTITIPVSTLDAAKDLFARWKQ